MDIALKGYDHVTGERHAPSLRATFALLHIPIISSSLARQHKREMIDDSRVGIYRVLGPIFYALSSFLDLISRSDRRFGIVALCMAVTIVASTVLAFALPYFGLSNTYFIVLAIAGTVASVTLIVYGSIASFALSGFSPFSQEFGLAATIWERHEVDPFDPASLLLYRVPEHLHGRMRKAAAIDGVRVHVERFKFDPLVVATREHFLYTETVYIGGWDTGKPAIDNA
jgi:hypothetical protein